MRYSLAVLLLLSSLSFAWWDGSFAYRTQFNISNPGPALTDYQVQVSPNLYNSTGLVGSWHFSEGSGTRAADSSGLGNDGTLTGPAWVSGTFGSGLQFNGVNQYVDAGNFADNLANFSVSAWVKTTSVPSVMIFTKITNTGNGKGWALYTSAGHAVFLIQQSGTIYKVRIGTTPINNGNWHFVSATKDASNAIRLYVDGVSEGSDTSGGTVTDFSNANNVKIGANSDLYASFNGTIDEVRVYNRSLSAQEISELYNATKARLDYADLRFAQPYTIYETPISLSGAGSDLTDYQVLINITNQTILSHMRSDGADLRFFSSQTSSPYSSSGLPYWLESINSSQAKVWVKANVSSGGSTIYMYYGNISAIAQGNGSATFVFFDDFSGDLGKWNLVGSVGITSGKMTLTGAAGWQFVDAYTKNTFDSPMISEFIQSDPTGNPSVMVAYINGQFLANNNNYFAYYRESDSASYINVNDIVYGSRTPGEPDLIKIVSTGSTAAVYADGTLVGSSAYSGGTASHGLSFNVYGTGDKISIDDVRVRKYSSAEPSATIGSETVKSSGNEASIPYWLESDKSAWVKVPGIPAGLSTVYSYYGSPSASSSSNGSATFDFFDDFNRADGALGNGWVTVSGAASISGNRALLADTPSLDGAAHNPASGNVNGLIVESDVQLITAAEPYAGTMVRSTSAGNLINYGYGWLLVNNANIYIYDGGAAAAGPIAFSVTLDKGYNQEVRVASDNSMEVRIWLKGTARPSSPAISKSAFTPSVNDGTGVRMIGAGNYNVNHAYFDNFRVRKYTSSEPSASSGVEQQSDATPPSVSISSPLTLTYSSVFVPLNFTASAASGISSCKYELNGVNTSLAGCQNITMTASSGSNSLTVWAFDGSNWGSASVSFNVSLDTAPPSISITSPVNISYPSAPVPVIFVVSDNVAVGSCVVRLNNSVNSSSCNNYSLSLGNGAYTLNITANDTFGNMNSSAVSFSVSLAVSVSNSTTTNSNGIGNVSLSGIPPAASQISYSVGSSSFSKSFSVSSGVSSVRVSARATLSGSPVSGKTLAFEVS